MRYNDAMDGMLKSKTPIWSWVGGVFLVGCGGLSEVAPPGPQLECEVGSVERCTCADGALGTRVCEESGVEFGECACREAMGEDPPQDDLEDIGRDPVPDEPDEPLDDFPIGPYGLPCDPSEHPDGCYIPGTKENPITSQRCESNDDCEGRSLCQASGGDGKWCFASCATDDDCLRINSNTDNPLFCAPTSDADDSEWGGSPMLIGRFCVQSSEP